MTKEALSTVHALKLALEALEAAYARLVTKCEQNLVTYNGVDVDTLTLSQEAITAIKEALANEALDKKAENARELGLNYEPEWTLERIAGMARLKEAQDKKLAQPEQDGKCKYCTDGCPACDARKLPEQEPVAWVSSEELLVMRGNALGGAKDWRINVGLVKQDGDVGLYTTPPQRTWVGLTDDEIDKIYEAHHNQYGECESVNLGYERAIEAKLKEKNNV